MSSDSELEEFYDASEFAASKELDKSPKDVSPGNSDQKWLSEVEKEEEELKLLKERADERRKKEDAEIAERLARLEKYKSKQIVDQSSEESSPESKMTKLYRLRQQMSDDLSDSRQESPSHAPSTMQHSSDATENNTVTKKQYSNTNKLTDNQDNKNQVPCDKNNEKNGDKRRTSVGASAAHFSGDATDKLMNKSWTDEDVSEIVREVCEVASKNSSLGRDSKNNSLTRDGDIQRAHSKEIKDLSTALMTGLKQLSMSQFDEGSPDEPDIVKSTRITPPQTLAAAPVAPPRRRRRAQTSTAEESGSEGSTPITETAPTFLVPPPRPQQLPRLSAPPLIFRGSIGSEMEYSLDVDSALGGNRHIHADDITVDSTSLVRPPSRVNSLERGALLRKASIESNHNTIAGYLHESDQYLRPRSNSGRLLTDEEILESVMVLNLDTGEQIPLSVAEEKLPQCVNPLALHIMRLTKEYNSHSSLNKGDASDDDFDTRSEGGWSTSSRESTTRMKADKLKRLIGKSVKSSVKKVKKVAEQSKKGIAEVLEGDDTEMENEVSVDGKKFKFKRSRGNKGPYSFAQFRILQDLSGHAGAVWTMKFSPCGRLLASGGQDSVLRVWVLKSCHNYFDEMRVKSNDLSRLTPAQSEDSLDSISSDRVSILSDSDCEEKRVTFMKKPFCVYRGHTADLLDIAWSKNNFILSSSMDKTVRLWHISRRECLCTFQHIDFVTAIVFHPRDDRYFLSGSLDGNLRLWNIPDKKVTLRNEVTGPHNLITTANFCDNGRYAVVGMYDGRCILFHTEKLKYYTQINVRSTRGKNRGRKITGVEPIRLDNKNLMLITSNDSRIRLYDLRDLTLTCKFKGHINNSSQIKASFSGNGQSIISGSEDHFVYVWKTQHDYHKMSSARRDRNHYWEAIKVHNAVVTAAIFASKPEVFVRSKSDQAELQAVSKAPDVRREVIVSADFNGLIKIVQNSISC